MIKIIAITLIIIALCLMTGVASKVETVDIVFKNGNVYTVNDRQPRAQAIAVKGDRIVFVGSDSEAQKYTAKQTRVVDLHGQTVVPGMTDAHYHLIGVGQREMTLNLEGTTSLEDFLAKVKARVERARPGEWVTGRGWIETFWKPPQFPTRQDLDAIAPRNPVFLRR